MKLDIGIAKKDVIVSTRPIANDRTLVELRASQTARVSRWVVVETSTGRWMGEVKRPRYGHRMMEVYSSIPYWQSAFFCKMQAPAIAEEYLVEKMVAFVCDHAPTT